MHKLFLILEELCQTGCGPRPRRRIRLLFIVKKCDIASGHTADMFILTRSSRGILLVEVRVNL